jgi:hypothetical protein
MRWMRVFALTSQVAGAALLMTDEKRISEKKNYEQPRVTVISLRPEEAVLSHCKTSGAAGPTADCRHAGGCSVIGS